MIWFKNRKRKQAVKKEPIGLALIGESAYTYADQILWTPDGESITALERAIHGLKVWDQTLTTDLRTIVVEPFLVEKSFMDGDGWVTKDKFCVCDLTCFAWSSNSRYVACGDRVGLIRIGRYDEPTLSLVNAPPASNTNVLNTLIYCMAWAPDNQSLLLGMLNGSIKRWDIPGLQLSRFAVGHPATVTAIEFSPDGRMISTGGGDSTVRLWDPASGEMESELKGHSKPVYSIKWFSDSRRLVSASEDRSICVWDATTGHRLRLIETEGERLRSISLSADGKLVACSDRLGVVRVYLTDTGELVSGFDDYVVDSHSAIAFHPTKPVAAILTDQRRVKLWSVDYALMVPSEDSHMGKNKSEEDRVMPIDASQRKHTEESSGVYRTPEWDVFICHASEDKESFVRPLANALRLKSLRVWYDEFTLRVGDSLRRSIDRGLSKSRFGVVVISPEFFRKEWPQIELDGLTAREVGGTKVILPVWHMITFEEVSRMSPTLADRVAAQSKDGIDAVVTALLEVLGKDQA